MSGLRRSHVSCRLAYCRERSLTSSTASAYGGACRRPPPETACSPMACKAVASRGSAAVQQRACTSSSRPCRHHGVHPPVDAVRADPARS